MRVIYLVRHGETSLSSRSAYSALSDVPLTPEGRQQALRAGAELAAAGIDLIVSSPLRRARDTAQAIANATGAPVDVDERLREVDYGPLEGLDRGEAGERFGSDYRAWRERPFETCVAGMEPLPVALSRARSATADVVARAKRPVLVSHQGTLRLVLIALGRIGPGEYFQTFIATGGVLAVEIPDSSGGSCQCASSGTR